MEIFERVRISLCPSLIFLQSPGLSASRLQVWRPRGPLGWMHGTSECDTLFPDTMTGITTTAALLSFTQSQALAQLAVKPFWQCQWNQQQHLHLLHMEVSPPSTQSAVPGSQEDGNYKDTALLHGGIQQTSKPTGKNKNIGPYSWEAKHEPQNQHTSPWVPSHPSWNCSV